MSFCVGNDFDMLNSFLTYGLCTQMSHIRVKNHPFSTFPNTSSFYASYPTRFDACNAGHVSCGFAARPLRLPSIYDDAKSFYTRLFWDPQLPMWMRFVNQLRRTTTRKEHSWRMPHSGCSISVSTAPREYSLRIQMKVWGAACLWNPYPTTDQTIIRFWQTAHLSLP